MQMTNAFAILANHGRALKPSLIDYVQDRNGKIIYRNDTRPCERCNMKDWDGQPMAASAAPNQAADGPDDGLSDGPYPRRRGRTGYATRLRSLKRPIFGKTEPHPVQRTLVRRGTPDIVAGVYLGYDQPRSLGGYAQGGRIAAPIFEDFAKVAFKDVPVVPFRAPQAYAWSESTGAQAERCSAPGRPAKIQRRQ
jgi:penicillin-binding protein 1A